jgi:uncharacterized protein YaaQ
MKMIIAIIRDQDNDAVTHALTSAAFRVTRIASSGGFLRRGSSTLMIGVAEERVDEGIQIIRDHTTIPEDPEQKRATLFVLDVKNFTQI